MTSLTKGATRMTPAAIVRSNGQKIAKLTVGIQKNNGQILQCFYKI